MERRVSRSEWRSPDATPLGSPDPLDIEALKTWGTLEYTIPDAVSRSKQPGLADDMDRTNLEFQLFAPSKLHGTHQTIRLGSPTHSNTEPGFIGPQRNTDYYLASAASEVDRENNDTVALSGQQVRARSQRPCPGLAYPWKVLHLPLSSLSHSARAPTIFGFARLVNGVEPTQRRRPSKKSRIQARTAYAAEQRRRADAQSAEAAKKAAQLEKRTERNRVKKVKKKMREKAKKAEQATKSFSESSI